MKWILLTFAFSLSGVVSGAFGDSNVPNLYDPHHFLSGPSITILENLVREHEQLTGEELKVGVSQDKKDGSFPTWREKVFTDWNTRDQRQPNGVLFSLFKEDQTGFIETSLGFDTVMTETKSAEVLHFSVFPYLKKNDLSQALAQGVYSILETIGSPLVQSGQAEEILKQQGFTHVQPENFWESLYSKTWEIPLLIGLVFLLLVFFQIYAREVFFFQAGWAKVQPLQFLTELKIQFRDFLKRDKPRSGGLDGTW